MGVLLKWPRWPMGVPRIGKLLVCSGSANCAVVDINGASATKIAMPISQAWGGVGTISAPVGRRFFVGAAQVSSGEGTATCAIVDVGTGDVIPLNMPTAHRWGEAGAISEPVGSKIFVCGRKDGYSGNNVDSICAIVDISTGEVSPIDMGTAEKWVGVSLPVNGKVLVCSRDGLAVSVVDIENGTAETLTAQHTENYSAGSYRMSRPIGSRVLLGDSRTSNYKIVDLAGASIAELNGRTSISGLSLPVGDKIFIAGSGYAGHIVDVSDGTMTDVAIGSGFNGAMSDPAGGKVLLGNGWLYREPCGIMDINTGRYTSVTMPGNNPEHRTFSKPVGTKVLALSFDTNSNNNVPGAIVDLFTGEAAEIAMPSNPMYAISDPVGAKAFVGSMGDNHCAIVDFDEMSSTELNMPTITLGGYGWHPISLPVRGKVFVTSSGYGGAVVDITTGDFTVVRFPSGAPWGPSADISVPV